MKKKKTDNSPQYVTQNKVVNASHTLATDTNSLGTAKTCKKKKMLNNTDLVIVLCELWASNRARKSGPAAASFVSKSERNNF